MNIRMDNIGGKRTFFQKSTADGKMLLKDLSRKGPISKLNTFEVLSKAFLEKVLLVQKSLFREGPIGIKRPF